MRTAEKMIALILGHIDHVLQDEPDEIAAQVLEAVNDEIYNRYIRVSDCDCYECRQHRRRVEEINNRERGH